MKARSFVLALALGLGLALLSVWVVAGQGGWAQSNVSGFGDPDNISVLSLASFGNQLYAGTGNGSGGAQLWRLTGAGWTSVITDGFGDTDNAGIDHLAMFSDTLYAGIWNETDGGEVWRSGDGLNWTRVISQGFGDLTNAEVFRLVVFTDALYASTWSYTTTHGAEIWRSGTGDSLDWTRVVSDGFNGDAGNASVLSFEVYSAALYAGTYNVTTGGEVWRSTDGSGWSQVNSDGFGATHNRAVSALAVFSDALYASTLAGGGYGSEVWRCQVCDGADWVKVVDNGFGITETLGMNGLEVFEGRLYFVVGNSSTGLEVWRTADGTNWEQAGFAGFGDSDNYAPYWDNSVTVSNGYLYVGTCTFADGGEVWQYLPLSVYLPAVMSDYPYFDDFSSPGSGWYTADGVNARYSYQSGEYEILLRNTYRWTGVTAPSGGFATIQADMRRRTGSDSDYGLLFGLVDWDRFYVFMVYPDTRYYSVWRVDPGDNWVSLVPWTYSSHINSGSAWNQLRVTRYGSQISVSVNGHLLTTTSDATYAGHYVGVYADSGSTAPVSLRYDNFRGW